jgi:two-component system, chemotaxis family, CheB/CheR fusion protein
VTDDAADFEQLLDFLYQTHGFDFTGYKRSTLTRRVRKRLDDLHVESFAAYLDFLQVHPEEFGVLFDTILINVTAFFRDAAAWDFLRETVIPRIVANNQDGDLIRVWCAGCASGEEAYTLAMVFAEAIGVDAFRRQVKIYATDVDEDALQAARNGSYALKDLHGVSDELREKYFETRGQRAIFHAELRRSVIFGRHDLVHDAPISRLDLLTTRNTLMYFTAEAQKRILTRLHYALNDNGFLFLGRAEMLLTHNSLFTPLDMRHRVFTKVPAANLRDRLLVLAGDGEADPETPGDGEARMRDMVLDAGPIAEITVDSDGVLLMANAASRDMFGLGRKDAGRRLQDLELSYRPVELRSRIEEVRRERRPLTVSEVERVLSDGSTQFLDVIVSPLLDDDSVYLGSTVAFVDVTSPQKLRNELQRNKQELETAYEELQSTNEELETTNEELQSTVEELETTNEELQSANEELETMNEELQSTNGELQTINVELRQRTVELDRVNAFMDSVLTSLRAAVVVVDADLRVQIWNARAEDLWGVREAEVVGRSLAGVDFGLPLDELMVPLRRCVAGDIEGDERTVEATNRRGRPIACRVTVSPLLERAVRRGAVVLMEELVPAPEG